MRIGIMGLGKVGLPVALSLAVHGKHEVNGYDPSAVPADILEGRMAPPREEGVPELLAMDHGIGLASDPGDLVAKSDLVIIAVPTPHGPGYGGEVPVTGPARSFDHAHLFKAADAVSFAAARQRKHITISVLSTVLPGIMARLSTPSNEYATYVYHPVFISLGTVIPEFEYPPFILCGVQKPEHADPVREMYKTLPAAYGAFFSQVSIETAEVAKMIYNAWGALRITFANQVAELCEEAGGNCDDVQTLLHFAPSAVRAGMPDGGPCRPRDLIALSWLAQGLGLSHDLFRDIAKAREDHARWLASAMRTEMMKTGLNPVILGRAYKPETDLADGSPSLLVQHYLGDCIVWEPGMPVPPNPSVYLVAVNYPELKHFPYVPGSVVIDPWGYVADRPGDGISVIRLGRKW